MMQNNTGKQQHGTPINSAMAAVCPHKIAIQPLQLRPFCLMLEWEVSKPHILEKMSLKVLKIYIYEI